MTVVSVGTAWAGHPVQFALLSHRDWQFVAYYNEDRVLTVWQRRNGQTLGKYTLLAEGGFLTGRVARPILGREAKVAALKDIVARLGLTPADVLAVGDGANDLGMLGLAGTGVALHAKPVVQAQAKVRVNHGDLSALLFLQGIARSDFVT